MGVTVKGEFQSSANRIHRVSAEKIKKSLLKRLQSELPDVGIESVAEEEGLTLKDE